jgi:hypothetical protein
MTVSFKFSLKNSIFHLFKLQFERMVGFDEQMYKIAEEFGLELIHSGEAPRWPRNYM